MVLEEVGSGQEPSSSFSDTVPTSDVDPYASGNSNPPYSPTRDSSYIKIEQAGAQPIYVNLNNIPHPLFVSGNSPPLARTIATATRQNCQLASQVLHRPATQEEADAFAFHTGKSLRVGSYGFPSGIAVATLQFLRTNGGSYRFPGWTPMKEGGRFSPDVFGPLRGQMARSAWQASRLFAYLTIGSFLGQTIFGTYAISSGLAARVLDPRLKPFVEALRKRQQEGGKLHKQQQQDQGDGPKAGETYDMARQRRGVQRQTQAQRRPVDDSSPTGGAFEEDLMQGQTDTGLLDDSQARSQNYGSPGETRTDGSTFDSSRAPSQQQPRQQRTQSTPRQSSSPSEQSKQKSSGSSWDRVRQNAMTDNQNQQSSSRNSPASQSNSSGNDSFSFAQADEDRQLARSEAQKEFDARVEREREGKDFQDGGGGRKRW